MVSQNYCITHKSFLNVSITIEKNWYRSRNWPNSRILPQYNPSIAKSFTPATRRPSNPTIDWNAASHLWKFSHSPVRRAVNYRPYKLKRAGRLIARYPQASYERIRFLGLRLQRLHTCVSQGGRTKTRPTDFNWERPERRVPTLSLSHCGEVRRVSSAAQKPCDHTCAREHCWRKIVTWITGTCVSAQMHR